MKIHRQFLRYAAVGLASNALIYGAYIVLTRMGMAPKLAMSLLYGVGVLQTFVFNTRWTFRFGGAKSWALVRYLLAYAGGYVLNLAALMLLVDQVGMPHQLVQGLMIIVVAVALFLAQRYWVFPSSRSRAGHESL